MSVHPNVHVDRGPDQTTRTILHRIRWSLPVTVASRASDSGFLLGLISVLQIGFDWLTDWMNPDYSKNRINCSLYQDVPFAKFCKNPSTELLSNPGNAQTWGKNWMIMLPVLTKECGIKKQHPFHQTFGGRWRKDKARLLVGFTLCFL